MSELENFNYECLYAHNGLRKSHGVDPLEYNKDLAKAAQAYAEIIAAKDSMSHSKPEERDNAGENLAMAMRPFVDYVYSGLGASVSWYSEIKDYDFSKEAQSSNKPTGHFTQVIWKGSQEAGFGRAMNQQTKSWYIVGRYKPAGNFLGEYKNNVPALPRGMKWDNVPIVKDHLDELRTMEYTDARKHILDDWEISLASGKNETGSYYEITETFIPPSGPSYTGKKSFTEDPTKKPRPVFGGDFQDPVSPKDKNSNAKNTNDVNNKKSDGAHKAAPNPKETEKFINAVVESHNRYRSTHGVGGLKLNPQLSAKADEWAQKLAQKNQMAFSHYLMENSEIGENITSTSDKITEKSAKEMVDKWYEEGRHYVYNKEPANFKEIGHFSQIIWKNSKAIGIGVAQHNSGKNYIVCFYQPPGNITNKFIENVMKRKS